MPVVNFHLIDTPANRAGVKPLLEGACALYAEVLGAPLDRIRCFVTFHDPDTFLAGGALCSENGQNAPFFDFIVLDGRSLEQRHRLLAGFTDLLVEQLGVERDFIRGCCRRVPPEDWAIGGVPASEKRKAEIEARARQAAPS
ncbi:MAG: tautomerase family protein [Rhodocyclaceae bacterium]|nr:tautomerase family protein [Rhodocyclaceae bacterium]